MGFFDLFRKKPGTDNPEELITKRWVPNSDGTYSDIVRNYDSHELAARFGVRTFETWFHRLEQRLGQSLGRRLAHAALEHEEYMIGLGGFPSPSGRDISRWSGAELDWQSRGMGHYSMLEDGGEARILIENPASASICSGFITGAWENATGKRHRFLWSQNTEDGLIVTLSLDEKSIPSPTRSTVSWPESASVIPMPENIEESWEDLRIDSSGVWSIMGERRMVVHRDLILRFEEFCLPYLQSIEEGRQDMQWPLEDEQQSIWWTAAADSMRETFFESGRHILVSKPEDWIRIARRHLSIEGLGGVKSAKSIDSHGGVELQFSGCFHPALAGGVLLACWERAHGRRGSLKCTFNSGAVSLSLSSSVAIAE